MTTFEHPGDARLIDRIAGEIPSSERALLDQHLTTCPDCRLRLTQFQELVAALRLEKDVGGPIHVLASILERQSAGRMRSRHGWLARRVPALLVAAIVFSGGYLGGRWQAGMEDRPTPGGSPSQRPSLPAPPPLGIESSSASLGDLAFAPWLRDSLHTEGQEAPSMGDSL